MVISLIRNIIVQTVALIMRISLISSIIVLTVGAVNAQQVRTPEEEAAYTKTISERAGKIVKTLAIADEGKATRVQAIIAGQYRKLSEIHDASEAKVRLVKQQAGDDKEKQKQQAEAIETEATASLDKLHTEYLAALSAELTPGQVEAVKDGMTYGVLPITYKGYVEMIPTLTEEQKTQIMNYLVEAREHAMDAGSSDKKHWWFGKYKGRINNYLSAAGYNMKKEGEEWEKRRKAAGGKS
jgi:Na+-transporting NADH:ubiquinone oxidoreductase subunit NqrC